MKIVMDADCLIKLAKAGLKEPVCSVFTVVIPQLVKKEVVDKGRAHPESAVVAANVEQGLLSVARESRGESKGEDAALRLYRKGGFDAVASDDHRFLKRLKTLGIAYVTPGVFLFLMARDNKISTAEALEKLDALAPFISRDEYVVVKLKLEAFGKAGP
jgi:rRNA-processing protein FCF1